MKKPPIVTAERPSPGPHFAPNRSIIGTLTMWTGIVVFFNACSCLPAPLIVIPSLGANGSTNAWDVSLMACIVEPLVRGSIGDVDVPLTIITLSGLACAGGLFAGAGRFMLGGRFRAGAIMTAVAIALGVLIVVLAAPRGTLSGLLLIAYAALSVGCLAGAIRGALRTSRN